MKKVFKYAIYACVGVLAMGNLTSCDNDDPEPAPAGQNDSELQAIATQYVNGTVNKTYELLAAETKNLVDKLEVLKTSINNGTATDAQIQEVCDVFLKARAYYETSEAFLFGAATQFGIDPHIDTWPLDVTGLATTLSNPTLIEALNNDEDGTYAGGKLGPDALGFHGIEFIIFRDGKARTADALMGVENATEFAGKTVTGKEEVAFATAVAKDLRNRCFQLEVAWNADAPADHMKLVAEDLELPVTVNDGELSYTQNLLAAGQAGSTYKSWREVMSTILIAGCQNISNEVGNTKMGKPYTGEDTHYIESPYSENSFTDFHDNMLSIEYSYYGGRADVNTQDQSKSIHNYLSKYNPDLDKKVANAINDAIAKIDACPKPFVDNYNNAQVKAAIDACNSLSAALLEAADWISKN